MQRRNKTWLKVKKECPHCGSDHYRVMGNSCTCQNCGKMYRFKSFAKPGDLTIHIKSANLRKNFREKYKINKSFGVLLSADGKYVRFSKKDLLAIYPMSHPKLAYTIASADFCKKIGKGIYNLTPTQSALLFKLTKCE